jgi:hypothetical protein
MRSTGRRNIDHTSHASKAVQGAEVTVSAGLRKGVFVNEPCVIKNSCVTIHVITGTELLVGCARGAAGNTVGVAAPVHRTVSPTEMFNVSGTKRILFPDGPTATSKTWLPVNRLPLGS